MRIVLMAVMAGHPGAFHRLFMELHGGSPDEKGENANTQVTCPKLTTLSSWQEPR
jgi:hypothetical protein